MKNLERISKRVAEWADMSGISVEYLRQNINKNSVSLQKCETKDEMDTHGVDYNYPYVLVNPFNVAIETETEAEMSPEEKEFYRRNFS